MRIRTAVSAFALAVAVASSSPAAPPSPRAASAVYPQSEGFVDAHGVFVYWKSVGRGAPSSSSTGDRRVARLLPAPPPSARADEPPRLHRRARLGPVRAPRGREALHGREHGRGHGGGAARRSASGRVDLLGHSFGGVLAQAYAFKYPQNLSTLILCSTFHTTKPSTRRSPTSRPRWRRSCARGSRRWRRTGSTGRDSPGSGAATRTTT